MRNFGEILLEIVATKEKPDKWKSATYQSYYDLLNTPKGDSIEESLERFLTDIGLDVLPKQSRTGDDTTIIGYKGTPFPAPIIIEDKGCSQDKSGKFQFNHVRRDKIYDYLLLIGVMPEKIVYRLYTKSDVLSGRAGTLTPMGKDQGGVGDEGTFKITKSEKDLSSFDDKFLDDLLGSLGLTNKVI